MAPRPQNQKRRPESARRANRIIQTRTLLLLGVFGVHFTAGSWLAQGFAGLIGAVILIWLKRAIS